MGEKNLGKQSIGAAAVQLSQVTSGIPYVSVVRSMLFNVFINNPGRSVDSEMTKLSDITELFRVVKTKADC